MRNENGYVLVLVLVMVCALTLAVISLTNLTTQASYIAVKRAASVQAVPLAESAALEGLWQLKIAPSFRDTREKHWSDGWYRYTIIDQTPLVTDNDLNLEVLGEGFFGKEQRRVRLLITRPNLNADFVVSAWREEN